MSNSSLPNFFEKELGQKLARLDRSAKLGLVRHFWPSLADEDFREDHYTVFLGYVALEVSSLRNYDSKFAAQSFEATASIVKTLGDNADKTRAELAEAVKREFLNFDNKA